MSYHAIKNQLRSNRNKEHTVKIILYIILISAIIIFWFLSAKSVKSLRLQFLEQSEKNTLTLKENFTKKIDTSQKDAIELGILGEKMTQKGYPQYGILILEKAIAKDASIRDLNLYTAKVYFDIGDYEKAKTLALKACDLDPLNAPTYSLLTEIYKALGDEKNSEICYNKFKHFSEDK